MMAVQAGNVVLMMASLPSPIGQLKAGKLLTYTTEILNEEFAFAEVNRYVKRGFSYTADPAMIAAIAKANDVVITAIGD